MLREKTLLRSVANRESSLVVKPVDLSPTSLRRLQGRLLRWFARHQRVLPWRQDRDPYRIWVSEVMLQQTQVATVIPYFERFLIAFPTVAELAAADEQAVLRLWEGLGYYRRAKNLHRAARQLVAEHAGQFPDDPEAWQALPGIGRYMTGAILSQAFERRLPIVEANSKRVLCRLFAQRGDPASGPVQRWLWQTAGAVLPSRRIGEFNQALMELGALVCTPANPRCPDCPLAEVCAARQRGIEREIPPPARQPTVVEVQEAAVVVRHGNKVLFVQRPETGRWAGMWEFPHGALQAGESHAQAAARIAGELGLNVRLGGELLTIRHGVTHHRITMICFKGRRRGGSFRSAFYVQGRWLAPDELQQLPVSVPQRKLARFVAGRTND
jgi:A/G-specific adenine glycosylase